MPKMRGRSVVVGSRNGHLQARPLSRVGLLLDSGLVQSRREGKRTFYRLNPPPEGGTADVIQLAVRGARELPEHNGDQINLKRIVNRRREQAQVFFNQIAGRFDRVYGPGRSWQAFGQLLLRVLPPLVVADLGSGEGLLSELLARSYPPTSSPYFVSTPQRAVRLCRKKNSSAIIA